MGNLLLWHRDAPEGRVSLGALKFEAKAQHSALWVIDGQQRITSIVNAVDPEASKDPRFQLVYEFDSRQIKRPHDARGRLPIPLADLFGLPRAMKWVEKKEGKTPPQDVSGHIGHIAEVNQFLRDIRIPGSVVAENTDRKILREIFDRMNSTGKRLRNAEIFDALKQNLEPKAKEGLSTKAIADRIASASHFGKIAPDIILQAILARRHPDYG